MNLLEGATAKMSKQFTISWVEAFWEFFVFLFFFGFFLVWKILQPSGAHMFPFLWLQVLNLQVEN